MDLGYQSEVGWKHAARLLPVEGPVPKEVWWFRRIAEIEDKNMVFIARLPAIGRVNVASADDVGDPRVAFPPALVSGGKVSDNRVASGNGEDAHWLAGIGHVPNLVRARIACGVGPEHIDLSVMDRQGATVTHADHLSAAVPGSSPRDMSEVLRVRRISDVHDRRAVWFVLTGEGIQRRQRLLGHRVCRQRMLAAEEDIPVPRIAMDRRLVSRAGLKV